MLSVITRERTDGVSGGGREGGRKMKTQWSEKWQNKVQVGTRSSATERGRLSREDTNRFDERKRTERMLIGNVAGINV